LLGKCRELWQASGRIVPALRPRDNVLRLELANGSRILGLPGAEGTIRGYSAPKLVVLDEASRTPEALYAAVRPMLAVSGGRLVALSTPYAKQGWFFEAWESGEDWQRVRVRAAECPRIAPEFLAEERRALPPRYYRMEYECEFTDAVDAIFTADDVRRALDNDLQPLFGG
jgi:hypothetical protein